MLAEATNSVLQVHVVGKDGFDLAQAIPWLIAFAALAFSIYQFFTGTRIKRLEYLDGLAKTLREEPLLKAATLMLDWEVRTIEFGENRFPYCVVMLKDALAVHNSDNAGSKKKEFDEVEVLIRDSFDALFAFIENVQYAVSLGVITQMDVFSAPMFYYVKKLVEKDKWLDGAIIQYLESYGFPKAKILIMGCQNEFPPDWTTLTAEQIDFFQAALNDEKEKEANRKKAKPTL